MSSMAEVIPPEIFEAVTEDKGQATAEFERHAADRRAMKAHNEARASYTQGMG